eukprot:TRINITY_DN67818_c6_g1_i2.p1 TRINITY_DN67818_c6_g1~~TRINITY_DN67818_c6_g1_i2.p1  ORF type:complete len:342 (+),score=55.53 TRINITY_DN67818_c6_g1_i2:139-1164(+)
MHCVSLSAAPVLLLLRCFFFFSCFIASPLCWCSSSSPPPSNFPSTVPELPSIAKPFVGCPVHSQCERKADDTHYCAVLREDNQYEYYRNKYAAFMSSPVQFWNWCDLIARDCNEGCWRIVPCPSSSSSSSAPQQTGDTTVTTAKVAVQEGAGTTCELEQDIFGQYTGMFRNSWEDFLFPHNRLDILDGDCSQEVCVSFSPIYKDGSEGSLLLGQTRILSEAMNDHKAKQINLAIVTPGACPSLLSSASSSVVAGGHAESKGQKNKMDFSVNGVHSGKHNTQAVEGTTTLQSGSSSFLVVGFLVICALCAVLVTAMAALALGLLRATRTAGTQLSHGATMVC